MPIRKVTRRHNVILNELRLHGEVDLEALAQKIGVHEMTIRRDLKLLEEAGFLIRTPKGAKGIPRHFLGFSSDSERLENAHLKQAIAEYVARFLIKEGESLFLGPGTTILKLAEILPAHFHALTLYTNAMDIISYEFSNNKYKTHITGGELSTISSCLYGRDAEKTLQGWHVDKVFLEADAVVPDLGCVMIINNMESTIIPQALKLGPEVYVLADSTKFGKLALYRLALFNEITAIVTNVLPSDLQKNVEEHVRLIQINELGQAG